MSLRRPSPIAAALVFVLPILACSSGGDSSSGTNKAAKESRPVERVSPLGLGQPDPERIFARALEAFDANEPWAFLAEFAFLDADGRYFVPQPRSGDQAPDLRPYGTLADGLRQFLSSDYAKVRYVNPVNVRNVPPTVEVIIKVDYDFESVSEAQRDRILANVNDVLVQRYGPSVRPLTWDDWKRQLLNAPRESTRRFVFVDAAWRFDAAWVLKE